MNEDRKAYERSVLMLAELAQTLLREGKSEESVARMLVDRRNALKREARIGLPSVILALIEQRNRQRYGDPVGPTADALYVRYGSWAGVIAAAARSADLRHTPL